MPVTVTFTYPTDYGTRLTAAVCGLYGYRPTLPDGTPNPQAPQDFTAERFIDHGFELVKGWESQQAAEAARRAALAGADSTLKPASVGVNVVTTP
jgi:hypothetical protein